MMDPWISSSPNSDPEAFFAAYGRTEDEARAALNRGLDEYRRQLGARVDPAWVDEAKAEAEFKTVSLGACYRDGTPLSAAPERGGPVR